jgi:hypothetical protein
MNSGNTGTDSRSTGQLSYAGGALRATQAVIMNSSAAMLTPRTPKDTPLWKVLVDDAFEGGILACLAIT